MSGSHRHESLDRRLEEVRQLMRERRAVISPDPFFVDRVVARLPRPEGWMLAWAARRVLPVTLAVAAMLTVAVFVTERTAEISGETTSREPANDPLDWLLDNGRGIR